MAALAVAGHLSAAELGRLFRAARDRVERGHLQVVWLLVQGRGRGEVARVTGLSGLRVAEVARRYDEKGPDGPGDQRRGNAGAEPLLGAEDEAAPRARRRGRRPTAGRGRGGRWRRGWRPGSAARPGHSGGGTASGSSAATRGCRARGTPRRRAPGSGRNIKSPPSWCVSVASSGRSARSRSGPSTSTGSG